jgi:hypothetical protein
VNRKHCGHSTRQLPPRASTVATFAQRGHVDGVVIGSTLLSWIVATRTRRRRFGRDFCRGQWSVVVNLGIGLSGVP